MQKLGKTGKFPDGKINKDDEGEIRILVGREKDKNLVVIRFGTPVAWLALKPNQAIAVGNMLIKHAKALQVHSGIYQTETDLANSSQDEKEEEETQKEG